MWFGRRPTGSDGGLDALVRRLLVDKRFARRFARDPRRACASYEVSAAQLEAVIDGNEAALLAHGLDPEVLEPRENPARALSAVMIKVGGSAAALLASLGMSVAPAAAIRAASTPRYFTRRAIRAGGRLSPRVSYVFHPINVRAARKQGSPLFWVTPTGRVSVQRASFSGPYDTRREFEAALGAAGYEVEPILTPIDPGDPPVVVLP